jgi:hypothetical protein
MPLQHGFLAFTRANKSCSAKSGFNRFNISADAGLRFFTTLSET